MENAGRVLTRREILDHCWGSRYPDQNKTLETHIKRLRDKIGISPRRFTPIRTVRGVGYIYDLDERPLRDVPTESVPSTNN